jgi:hypothetical protein
MTFKEATDQLCEKMGHDAIAEVMGISVQAIRQARLDPMAKAYREPPKNWRYAVVRLAEREIMKNRALIAEVRSGENK